MSSGSFDNIEETDHQIYITVKDKDNDTSHHSAGNIISEIAVWRALFANIGIAALKAICWSLSGSSAMLSEAIHSGADSFNSACLLVGLKRGSKPADKLHPFGYGLEANIWALFACVLMLVGTAVSIFNGFNRLFNEHSGSLQLINNYHLIAPTLMASIVFEIWAVLSASAAVLNEAEIKAANKFEAFFHSFKYINQIKSPTTKFVWYEDTIALAGVIVAFIAITLSKFFVDKSLVHIPDAIASILIGFMLLSLAFYLLKHNVNFLTGVAAKPQVEELIRDIASKVNGVSRVYDLKTMDMGTSGLIVNMEIEVNPEIQVKEADDIADKLEKKIREKIKDIAYVTIEVQADDTEDNWAEKFKKLIEEGKSTGILKPREAKILSKFFDFTDTVVWEIMVPRTDVTLMDAESGINELIDIIINSGHTRILIYKENIDNITGVINAKDILKVLKNNDKDNVKIEDLVREITIVPENKSISDMLNDFIVKKSQIAAVVDEHGGLAGILTVEDILEEIVGEIWDEYDVEVPEVIKIDENTLSVYSKMNIYDLNERFNLDLPTDDFQTVGGLVFGLLGREPQVNDEVEITDINLKVESIDGHKITRVALLRADGFVGGKILEEEAEN